MRRLIAPIVGVLVFFGLWEAIVALFDIRPFILKAPSSFLPYLVDDAGLMGDATLDTALRAIASLAIAALVSLCVGALLSASRFVEEATNPILILIQVTPFVLYITSVYIWLSSSTLTILFVTSIVCTPAFVFATVQGLRSADPATVELLRRRRRLAVGDVLAPAPAIGPPRSLHGGALQHRSVADRRVPHRSGIVDAHGSRRAG